MSVSVSDNNTMTTSATSTELPDTNSVSTPNIKAGIPAIPKRPTIIRVVDKQNVQGKFLFLFFCKTKSLKEEKTLKF